MQTRYLVRLVKDTGHFTGVFVHADGARAAEQKALAENPTYQRATAKQAS